MKILRSKDLIIDEETKSRIKIVSGRGIAKSGFNCDLVVFDEFFEIDPAYAEMTWMKVKNAGMARENSLVLTISHANYNHSGPAYESWLKSRDIIEGRSDNWTTYALHYGVDEYANWQDQDLWWSELPGVPELVDKDWYIEEFNNVKDSATGLMGFRCFHLNQLTSVPVHWLSPATVAACKESYDESKLWGLPVSIGVDAAKSYDIYSYTISAKIEDKFYTIQKAFIPEKQAEMWEKKHHVPYRAWALDSKCNLELTPGDCIDHLFVYERLKAEAAKFKVRAIMYDPHNFEPTRQMLWREGFNVKEVKQSPKIMGVCFKNLETLFLTGKLRHTGNPLFLNHVSNCVPDTDKWNQLALNKASDVNKIDLVDSTAISLAYFLEFDEASVMPKGQKIFELL